MKDLPHHSITPIHPTISSTLLPMIPTAPPLNSFDRLPESAQIRGVKGTYQITQFLNQRGIGYLYAAEQYPEGQPVTIRDYWLPPAFFNATEAQHRKHMFKSLAGLSLADGRVQDMRVVVPWEAIADPNQNRCYLVTQGTLNSSPSLRDYQILHGSLGEGAVREGLSQALQTLEFLHSQKFCLPNGQHQTGIIHGNLSLESLLLYTQPHTQPLPETGDEAARFVSRIQTGAFTLYLCDLALWERVFDPAIAQAPVLTARDDLQTLGKLAFSLLTGDRPHPETGEPLNPKQDDHWPSVSPLFKQYLLRLMGVYSPYNTANTARHDLMRLPPAPPLPTPILPPPPSDEKKSGFAIPWRLMLLIMLAAFLAQLLVWLFDVLRGRSLGHPPQLLCCVAEVANMPSATVTYTSEAGGTWSYVRQENLIEQGKTLDRVFEERLSSPPAPESNESREADNTVFNDISADQDTHSKNAPIDIVYRAEASFSDAIEAVRQRQADFFIAGLTRPTAIDLAAETIAYDGLVAIVAFSYAQRENSLPRTLNGQINLQHLQQLYTGQVTNWQQLGGANLPVQLYLPDSEETIRIIEDRILRDRQSIEQFRQMLSDRPIPMLPTIEMLRRVLQDFENNTIGAIAIAPMSQVFGQCSVYPLAIRQGNTRPVSPLIDSHGNNIRPSVDLCAAKGSYTQNTPVFRDQTYPLAYPISIVYRRDNRLLPIGPKFASILKTNESQRLLQQTGLVPIQLIP